MGHADEAVSSGRRAVALDPLAPFWNHLLSQTYVLIGRCDDAIRQAEITLDLVRDYWLAFGGLGISRTAVGPVADAVAPLESMVLHSGGSPYASGGSASRWPGREGERMPARSSADCSSARTPATFPPAASRRSTPG